MKKIAPLLLLWMPLWLLTPASPVQSAAKETKKTTAVASPTLPTSPQGALFWNQDPLTTEKVAEAKALLEKEIETIAKSGANTPDGQRRAVLKERLEWTTSLLEVVGHLAELEKSRKEVVTDNRASRQATARQEEWAPPVAPENPTPEGFRKLNDELDAAVREVAELTARAEARQQFLQGLPQRLLEALGTRKTAEKEAERFQNQALKEQGAMRDLMSLQAGNASLKAKVSVLRVKWLEAEQEYEKESVGARDQNLEAARLRQKWREKAFALYQDALNRIQENVLQNTLAELARKERLEQEATEPDQKFLAHWDAEVARLRHHIADLNTVRTNLLSITSEQEKQLEAEQEQLRTLDALVKQGGIRSETTAESLKETFRDLGHQRKGLDHVLPPTLAERQPAFQTRSQEINTLLVNWRDEWQRSIPLIESVLSGERKNAFRTRADQLADAYRRGLGEEKQLLLEITSQMRRLELFPAQRAGVLNDLEALVLAQVFWIQDVPPLGLATVNTLFQEIFSTTKPYSILNWWRQVLSGETVLRLLSTLREARFIAFMVLLVVVMPLFWRYLRKHLEMHLPRARRPAESLRYSPQEESLLTILSSLLWVSLAPLYLLAAAFLVRELDLPAAIGTVIQQVLIHLALFWLLWAANRVLLGSDGLARLWFDLPAPLALMLHRTIRVVLMAYLVCLLPWMIFRVDPFQFEALPRLGFICFEIGVMFAVHLLIRPRSPLIRHAFGPADTPQSKTRGFLGRHWVMIHPLSLIYMVAILLLETSGFRFGAIYLAQNGLVTLLVLFLMIGFSHLVEAMISRVVTNLRRSPELTPPGVRPSESRPQVARQISHSLQFLINLAGFYILAISWGLGQRALEILRDQTLYRTSTPDGRVMLVTLADLLGFVLVLMTMFWLLKHLPRLFELIFFSRMSVDAGVRYAVVTMSRYLVFLAGILFALTFLHLDLAQFGWLVAAISVGIGFGLQEIVANFVSGIILLVERPIRVGDTITVGATYGRVTRIKIRATTVLNSDNQELLVPNRDLITREVTNWTLANTTLRVVIPIGVAYGSDPVLVRTLLLTIAREQTDVLKEPPPEAYFLRHAASSLDFELRVFLGNPSLRWVMTDRLNTAINRRFREEGIEIPFPQQDLHLRSGFETLFARPTGDS
ncbi:MAG: mechanosensitive ion channel [Magnetococcales bacterium]|nr:mechanosensitive ion channel [Magnetococcales bacterium]